MPPPRRHKSRERGAYLGPACPRCGSAFGAAVLVPGLARCPRCRLSFSATVLEPVGDAGALVMPMVAGPGQGTPCARHARNVAEDACSRCGTFMCQLCRIASDGMVLCPGCFDRLASEGVLPSARRTYRDYSWLALLLALIGVPFMAFGLIIGPCAVWYAVRALRASRDPGVSISRGRAICALVLGTLEGAFGVMMLFGLLGAFR